ncbi:MAG TPA: phosphate ABC transporter substrate-binding protein [Methanomicrobia archaeon]|nr:phosphate ABC transporter substrate-binding protein [Methanomicrobia archaeon]HEX58838.1 phosphate ABC transporter substrate-binding protein [Methanomicrobia archaeon]
MSKKILALFLLLVAVCGCVKHQKLTVTGSTTLLPVIEECARLFMEQHPEVRITVAGGGSGHGIKSVGAGNIDIGMASRDVKPEELKLYPDLNPIPVAADGIAIIVHPDNPIENLTLEQIAKIFGGEIKNWKELGWEDAEIHVVTREYGSGTRATFEEHVLKPFNMEMFAGALVKPSNGDVRATVSTDRHAIGYISLGYVDVSVKAVRVDGVEPSLENVVSGEYPISRKLYLITKGEPDPLEKEFIEFVLGPAGQEVFKEWGYVPVRTTFTPTTATKTTS